MISGIKKIWIILEINNQRTNAGYGSKRITKGASVFQVSQIAVHIKMIIKNPILPTLSVIHTASLSILDNFCLCIILAFLIGLRIFFNSSNVRGTFVLVFVSIISKDKILSRLL